MTPRRCSWCGRFVPASAEPLRFRDRHGTEHVQVHCPDDRPHAVAMAAGNERWLVEQMAREVLEHTSPAVMLKAADLRATPGGLVRDATVPGVWWVTSSGRTRLYRVALAWDSADCTCPHGGFAPGQGGCYHVAAALLVEFSPLLDDPSRQAAATPG